MDVDLDVPHRRRALRPAVHDRRCRTTAPATPPRQRFRDRRRVARRAARAPRRVLAAADLLSATTASCAARRRSRSGYADAGVIVPIPGAPLGVALAVAGNPRYGKLDPQLRRRARGARSGAQRRRRRRAAAGSDRLPELRRSDDARALGALVAAVDGLAHAARAARDAVRLGQRQPLQPVEVGPHGRAFADRRVRRRRSTTSRRPRRGVQARGLAAVLRRPSDRTRSAARCYAESLGIATRVCRRSTTTALAREIALMLAAYAREHRAGRARRLRRRAARRRSPRWRSRRVDRRRIGHRARPVARWAPGARTDGAYVRRSVRFHRRGRATSRASTSWRAQTASSALRDRRDDRRDAFALRSRRTSARARRAHEAWSAPLRDFYEPAAAAGPRECARRRRRVSRDEQRGRDACARWRAVGLRRGARALEPRFGRRCAAFDAYVLPGGFAYEDRMRAGAVAAHDEVMDAVVDGARRRGSSSSASATARRSCSRPGSCPAPGPLRRPTAAFAPERERAVSVACTSTCSWRSRRRASRCSAGSRPNAVIPAWASHGEGRLAAADERARPARARRAHRVRLLRRARRTRRRRPTARRCGAAALTNRAGNVLAIMPHPERDAWTFMQRDGDARLRRARGRARDARAVRRDHAVLRGVRRAALAAAMASDERASSARTWSR